MVRLHTKAINVGNVLGMFGNLKPDSSLLHKSIFMDGIRTIHTEKLCADW